MNLTEQQLKQLIEEEIRTMVLQERLSKAMLNWIKKHGSKAAKTVKKLTMKYGPKTTKKDIPTQLSADMSVDERLMDYVYGELSDVEVRHVEALLATSAEARAQVADLRALRAAFEQGHAAAQTAWRSGSTPAVKKIKKPLIPGGGTSQ